MPKLTNEEFIKRVKRLVNDEYTFLEDYKSSHIKLKVIHNKCGHIYMISPSNFLHSGTRCTSCRTFVPHNKKTGEIFQKEVYEKFGNEYTLLTKYSGAHEKILILHNECGHKFEVYPDTLIRDKPCPKCSDKIRNTLAKFKDKVMELTGSEYTVLEQTEIKNRNTKIEIQHNICGFIFKTSCKIFLKQGCRCTKCAGNMVSNTDVYKSQVYELCDSEYQVLGEYKNIDTRILMKHTTCGRNFLMAPYLFKVGCRCPICNESKGERLITKYLDSKCINYIRQYQDQHCKNVLPLRFDFCIFKDDSLRLLIEYDGVQHFKPSFGEKAYKHTKKTDKIKTDYCKLNNIPLLRIPYTEFENVETILHDHLLKLKII